MAGGGSFGHPGHKPFVGDVKVSIGLMIIMAVIFAVVLVFAALPNHGPVASNYNTGAANASAIFVIVILVSTFDLLHYVVTHYIGKPEGRDF